MNSQVISPDLSRVPLRDGVKAVLENSQFSVTPISDEHNQGLVVPVDFLATSNGVRFVVKCLLNPSAFECVSLQALVEFSRSHGITEVMLIGDGEFSPEIIATAVGLSVRLTNQAAYQSALSNMPTDAIQALIKDDTPPTVSTPAVEDMPYVAKSAFDDPVELKQREGKLPPPLPQAGVVDKGRGVMSSGEPNHQVAPLPKKKKSGVGPLTKAAAVVILLGIIWVGYDASKAGLKQIADTAKVINEVAVAQAAPSVKEMVEKTIIETRKTSGLLTTRFDHELIGFMEPAVQVMIVGGRQPTSTSLEEMLGSVDPGFRVGSSALFTGEKAEELVSQVKSWSPLIEQRDDEFGSLSQQGRDGKMWTWVYHGSRITRKEQLDEALKHGGNFILKCGHCKEDSAYKLTAHAKFFVKPDCSHCGLTAHAFGPNTEGDYLRACDFLTGFKIPEESVAKFLPENPEARTHKNVILAHWSAILDRCDYEFDTKQKGAGSRDIWKLPQQTWDERVGDCEDTTILLADALISAGYDARVALGHWEGGGHAWCVVKAEGRQWILETTHHITGAASLRSMIKVGGDYVAMCTFNRDSIFLRRNAAHLSTPDYFSDNYWLTLNLEDVEGAKNDETKVARKVIEN